MISFFEYEDHIKYKKDPFLQLNHWKILAKRFNFHKKKLIDFSDIVKSNIIHQYSNEEFNEKESFISNFDNILDSHMYNSKFQRSFSRKIQNSQIILRKGESKSTMLMEKIIQAIKGKSREIIKKHNSFKENKLYVNYETCKNFSFYFPNNNVKNLAKHSIRINSEILEKNKNNKSPFKSKLFPNLSPNKKQKSRKVIKIVFKFQLIINSVIENNRNIKEFLKEERKKFKIERNKLKRTKSKI